MKNEPWTSGWLENARDCPDCHRTVRLTAVKTDPTHVEYRIICPNGCRGDDRPVLTVEGGRVRRGLPGHVRAAVAEWNARTPETACDGANRTRSWHDATGLGMRPCPVCGMETFDRWRRGMGWRLGCPEHVLFSTPAYADGGVAPRDWDALNARIETAEAWRDGLVACPECGRPELRVNDDGLWVASCACVEAGGDGFDAALEEWRRRLRERRQIERERRERVERNRRLLAELNMMAPVAGSEGA